MMIASRFILTIILLMNSLCVFSYKIVTLSPNTAVIVHDIILSANNVNNLPRIVGTIRYKGEPQYFSNYQNIGNSSYININKIISLDPDIIIAEEGINNKFQIIQLRNLGYNVITIKIEYLEDIAHVIRVIGLLVRLPKVSNQMSQKYENSIKVLERDVDLSRKPKVFIELSRYPLYTIGNLGITSEIVNFCGGKNIFQDLNTVAATVSISSVIKRDPDIIIVFNSQRKYQKGYWSKLINIHADNIYSINPNLLLEGGIGRVDGIRKICEIIKKYYIKNS